MKLSFLLLVLLGSNICFGASSEELMSEFKAEVRAEARRLRESDNPATQQRLFQWQELLTRLGQFGEDGVQNADTIRAIQAFAVLTESDRIQDLCQTLIKQLQADREKAESELAGELKKGLASALGDALSAKTIQAVDEPMAAITHLLENAQLSSSSDPKIRALVNQGQQLEQFLRQWQDYLSGSKIGAGGNRDVMLRDLFGSNRDFSAFFPRSKLLERFAEIEAAQNVPGSAIPTGVERDEEAKKMVAATHELRQMADTIQSLEKLWGRGFTQPAGDYLNTALNALRNLQGIYADLNQGQATKINLAMIRGGSMGPDMELAALRAQLVLYALPRVLGLAQEDAAQAGEAPATYLHRVLARAKERSDWPLLSRIVEVAQLLDVGMSTSSEDRTAVQSFLAGINQERARQFALAVSSFQAALKTGSQVITAELIGDHLEAICKDHPQEYEQGVQIALNPLPNPDPRLSDPRYRQIYPPGYSIRSSGAPTNPAPSLNVPPLSPRGAATPPPPQPATTEAEKAK